MFELKGAFLNLRGRLEHEPKNRKKKFLSIAQVTTQKRSIQASRFDVFSESVAYKLDCLIIRYMLRWEVNWRIFGAKN